MKTGIMLATTAAALIGLASSAVSQECGEASGQSGISISDLVVIYRYIGNEPSYPITSTSDCDNRAGITLGDAETLVRYIFFADDQRDCLIQSSYSFAPAPNDTVFFPFMVAIPDGVDSVELPVLTSFAPDTRAFYIPTLAVEVNGPALFNLVRRNDPAGSQILTKLDMPDTSILIGNDVFGSGFAGRQSYFTLLFTRNAPGLASVSCTPVARSSTLRIAVEKGGDLYTPVIQYYQVPLPHAQVAFSPSPLDMTAKAGFWSTASYQVTFASDLGPVSFKLATSDNWIVIDEFSPTGYTTPATITVRANASMLTTGNYSGQITFSDISPAEAEFVPAALDVALTVTEAVVYPPGDLNCDGMVSISDIALLIDCLFINTRQVPACE